jgi:hypothetical protein
MVLDLDVPLSEGKDIPLRRAWLVFNGVHDMSLPFGNTRLPTGCWLTSAVSCSSIAGGFNEYGFTALIPQFDEKDSLVGNMMKRVMIQALRVVGVASTASASRAEWGLTWKDRTALATDEDMQSAAGDT